MIFLKSCSANELRGRFIYKFKTAYTRRYRISLLYNLAIFHFYIISWFTIFGKWTALHCKVFYHLDSQKYSGSILMLQTGLTAISQLVCRLLNSFVTWFPFRSKRQIFCEDQRTKPFNFLKYDKSLDFFDWKRLIILIETFFYKKSVGGSLKEN